MDVREYRTVRGIEAKAIVAVLREKYPKYDKQIQSKVERPELYGVRLLKGAEKLITETFADAPKIAPKKDRRRLPQRVQCRLAKRDYQRLQLAFKRRGFGTTQDGLLHIILFYLEMEQQAQGIARNL